MERRYVHNMGRKLAINTAGDLMTRAERRAAEALKNSRLHKKYSGLWCKHVFACETKDLDKRWFEAFGASMPDPDEIETLGDHAAWEFWGERCVLINQDHAACLIYRKPSAWELNNRKKRK